MPLNIALRRWQTSSLKMRTVIIVVPIAVIVILCAGVVFATPHAVPLFATPLESEQLGQVDAQLAAWNIAHVTTADNIEVDGSLRNTVLLRISLAGLPRAHIATSNETLAKASALTPDVLLEAQSRSGLAGDIALALRSIDGIADASVVIAPARQGTFTDDMSSQASASVRLSLRPGALLSKASIDGISAFVASAVPFLDRSRVVLLDDHGIALTAKQSGQDEAETTRAALQSAFDTAFGNGATIVRVHALYDPHSEHFHEIDRLPVNGEVASRRSDERYQSRDKRYEKHDRTEERGSIERDHESLVAAGALSRLSIAVLVDQARNLDLEKIRSLAFAASGIDEHANSEIRVEAVPFRHPDSPGIAQAWNWFGALAFLIPYLITVCGCVAAIAFLRHPMSQIVRSIVEGNRLNGTLRTAPEIAPGEVMGLLTGEPPHTAAAIISALPTVTAAAVLDLYPSDERGAIVARMARQTSAFAPTWEQLSRVH